MDTSLTVILTGGTIEKVYPSRPDAEHFELDGRTLPKMLQRLTYGLTPHFVRLPAVDSLHMDHEYRAMLLKAVEAAEARVLISHGTSSMIATAEYLGERLGRRPGEMPRTVVLTGALQPAAFKESDAEFNVGYALACAQTLPSDVYVAMNGCHFRWDRVCRDDRVGLYFMHR